MPSHTFQAETTLQVLLLEQVLMFAQQLQRTAAQAPDGQLRARRDRRRSRWTRTHPQGRRGHPACPRPRGRKNKPIIANGLA
jgi:hypothetical protein